MHTGYATQLGTANYATRLPAHGASGFYRLAQYLTVSSLGLGTYLGARDEAADRGYVDAVQAALRGGINFLDTSLNYRHQNSELNIGAAIARMIEAGELRRDEFVVCTKAGYLVPGAVPPSLGRDDVAGGMHSLAPSFLADQLDRSRVNLGLETIDVFYLHNPETQLEYAAPEEFYDRMARAFEGLESLVAAGAIRWYGAATWNGFRTRPGDRMGLSLARLAELAAKAGGKDHHFRFIQLPLNLGMAEAFTIKREEVNGEAKSTLEAAEALGLTVVASASLLQSRLTRDLPAEVRKRLPGPLTDAQCALQFARSTPGIAVALAGMGRTAHVAENLGIASFPPATAAQYLSLFQ